MDKRLELHTLFIDILGNHNVYFQPPESITLSYPCIIYKRSKMNSDYANDEKYGKTTRYQVTAIDPDPDGELHRDIFKLPKCLHERHYVSGGLNHDVFEIHY